MKKVKYNFLTSVWQKLKKRKEVFVYGLTAASMKKVLEEDKELREKKFNDILEILKSIESNVYQDRQKLIDARKTKAYQKAYSKKKPLVSVRIATFNRGKTLSEKTIPSILSQTYENIEVVVVGDNCTDDTAERIAGLRDNRVRFDNMPYRGMYPENKLHKWYVASTTPANEALQMSQGLWIAPFDDDDEMMPNHIKSLLSKAVDDRLEFVYGKALSVNVKTKEKKEIGLFPPTLGQISFNSSLFNASLKFFEYDLFSWTVNEPGDWNLIRE